MSSPTYDEIAKDWDLWRDHIDRAGTMTREEFDAMHHDERCALIEITCGPEVLTVEQVLADCYESNGCYRFGVEGGSVLLSAADLRPLLEEAYDPYMPDWVAMVVIPDDTADDDEA
jgi:hypothetical protein